MLRKYRTAIVIPAYNPPTKLIDLVDALLTAGQANIVIVNDGSVSSNKSIFDALQKKHSVTVLNHLSNQGKGQALKTGFSFCLHNFADISGIITVDADGQHHVNDVLTVSSMLSEDNNSLLLGSRMFDTKIPLRSKFGNTLTRKIFSLVAGTHITDTQTGLRGIPIALLPYLLTLQGNRYEYEMNMLLVLNKKCIPFKEVPISTIYVDNNGCSHFNPIKDSFKIYALIFRFFFRTL